MVVAFDFDGVADNENIQRLAVKLKKERNEVWIITARKENEFSNQVLHPVLNKIGLSKYSVIYCDGKPKWELLKGINADIYIDNIADEFYALTNHTYIIPLLFNTKL